MLATEFLGLSGTMQTRALNFTERPFAVLNASSRDPNPPSVVFDEVVVEGNAGNDGELAILQSGQRGGRSNPQATIARTQQGVRATGVKFVNTVIPRFEADAIEAQKPVPGTDPKETVGRLCDRNRGRVDAAIL
jgi:hypothetical protein